MALKGRYRTLLQAIDATVHNSKPDKHYRLLEVGVYDGIHAVDMIKRLQARHRLLIEYFGFDLFEDLTPEMSAQERSKSRLPPTQATVERRLVEAMSAESRFQLIKGNTKDTIPSCVPRMPVMDLIFVDGGHSLETVDSDWLNVSKLMGPKTIAVLDDYYDNREDFGCRQLITRLQQEGRYDITLSDPPDHFSHTGLSIRMATVRRPSTARS